MMTIKEINELLAKTRNQKFRKVSERTVDGWNKISNAMRENLNDPEKNNIRNEAAKRAGITKRNDSNYRSLVTEINRKKAQDPNFAKNVSDGIKQKWANTVYLKKQLAKAKSQQKPVIDPNGKVWPSAEDAGLVWFPDKSKERATKTIRYNIQHNKGWKYES